MTETIGLAIRPGSLTATVVEHGKLSWAGSAVWNSAEDLAAGISELASERPARLRDISVVLCEDCVQVRVLDALPRFSQRELTDHLRLYGPRYFIQHNGRLVIEGASSGGAAIAAAAPESLLEAIAAGAAGAGLRLTRIAAAQTLSVQAYRDALSICAPADPSLYAAVAASVTRQPELNLLPPTLRLGRDRRLRRSTVRGLLALSTAAAIAILCYGTSLTHQLATVRAERRALKAPLDRALQAQRDLLQAREAVRFIDERRSRGVTILPVLGRLSAALPHSTFVTTLRLDDHERFVVSLLAPRAATVLPPLERADLDSVSIVGPINRAAVGAAEFDRFTVMFRARGTR